MQSIGEAYDYYQGTYSIINVKVNYGSYHFYSEIQVRSAWWWGYKIACILRWIYFYANYNLHHQTRFMCILCIKILNSKFRNPNYILCHVCGRVVLVSLRCSHLLRVNKIFENFIYTRIFEITIRKSLIHIPFTNKFEYFTLGLEENPQEFFCRVLSYNSTRKGAISSTNTYSTHELSRLIMMTL